MDIQTKFKVNDLVISKYTNVKLPDKRSIATLIAWEVTEIKTITCSAGTQVFYALRSIHALLWDDNDVTFIPEPDINKNFQLREDELMVLPEHIKTLLTTKS